MCDGRRYNENKKITKIKKYSCEDDVSVNLLIVDNSHKLLIYAVHLASNTNEPYNIRIYLFVHKGTFVTLSHGVVWSV